MVKKTKADNMGRESEETEWKVFKKRRGTL